MDEIETQNHALEHSEGSKLKTHNYLEGIRLFNEGQFWHAHEQWEACWLAAREPESTFYQGIIQAAAALVHWQRGNPRGLRRNWEKGRPKLIALRSPMLGLDLRRLIADMDQFVTTGGDLPPKLRYIRENP